MRGSFTFCSGVKLRFLQSIALAGLLGCCSGSPETGIAAAHLDESNSTDETTTPVPTALEKERTIHFHG